MHFITEICSQKVAQMFDVVDVIFDLPGYISGYAVSPESRFALKLGTIHHSHLQIPACKHEALGQGCGHN